MAQGPGGTVFVGSRRAGKVYALIDADGDFRAEKKIVVASGLNWPNGVAMRGADLYVAEVHRILRFKNIEERLSAGAAEFEVIADDLAAERHHGWKFIRFGPDGALYVPVGAPCNICNRENDDPRYASILRVNPDTGKSEVYASGIRNSVGFDWSPETGDLWFTDNGRDWMGDDAPSDELNRASRKGEHFGYPYCHAGDIADPEFGALRSCGEFRSPERRLGAHVAALGMRFYAGKMFPEGFRGDIFIAEHGSWNRTVPVGYRVVRVQMRAGKAVNEDVFASGWLRRGRAWGRPVDLMTLPDGSLLLSDDKADVVYRISYSDGPGK